MSRIPPLLCTLALVAGASPSFANSTRVPLTYVDRPLSLPDSVLRLDGGPRWPDYDAWFKHVVVDGPDLDFLNPGVSLGATDDLELGAVFPIRLSPDENLEDPRLYVLYQLQDERLSYGIFGELQLGFNQSTAATVGVPLYYDLSRTVRLETGGFLQIVFGDASTLNAIFPVYFPFQISPRFYAGPEGGIGLYGLFDDGGGIALPIGGFLGYTVGSGAAPLGDLYGRLRITDVPDGALELMFGGEFFFDI